MFEHDIVDVPVHARVLIGLALLIDEQTVDVSDGVVIYVVRLGQQSRREPVLHHVEHQVNSLEVSVQLVFHTLLGFLHLYSIRHGFNWLCVHVILVFENLIRATRDFDVFGHGIAYLT